VSLYDWLLFLHVLAAFAIVGAVVVFSILFVATRPGADPARALPALRLTPLARRLWDIGGGGTLVLGIWLALNRPEYEIWDGWIIAALVLWVIAAGSGARVGAGYWEALAAAREGGERVAVRTGSTVALHAVMLVAVAALLVVMIFKPGA
jgi:uncharacterized membrane protein